MTTNQQVVPSEWEPLRIAAFRAIWFASLAANVGTWFQNVGGVWLMTRFTASPLLIALIRTFFFIFFISVLWALLPVIVRQELRLGAPGYGLLLGCIGVGAVVGAAVLPLIQHKIPVVDQQVIISTVALALVMIALGFLRNLLLLCLIATFGGTGWIMLVSSFNVAAQEASPTWVRARALGAYLVVYQGGTAIGSLLWGVVAARMGDPLAMLLAALGAVLGLTAGLRWHLADSEK